MEGCEEWSSDPWAAEPDVGRVAHGVPDRVDRLAALGNALVPQIAEWIGRRILEYEGEAMTARVAERPADVAFEREVDRAVPLFSDAGKRR
jgi:hypothetical protein